MAGAASEFRMQLNPKHPGALLKIAEIMTVARNKEVVEEAVSRLESILAASPGDTEAIDAMAMAEWRLGRIADAEKRLDEALKKFPANLQSAVALARLKVAKGDFATAEDILNQVARNAPRSAAAEVALGEFYLVAKKTEKAEEKFRRALELDSNDSTALLRLGSLEMARNPQEADQVFRRLAALPDRRLRFTHVTFLLATGKKEAAIQELETLVKKDSADITARTHLVSAFLDTGKIQKAQVLLDAALKRNPKDLDALLQASEIDLKSGKVQEAQQKLTQVVHFKPELPQGHWALAVVYRAQSLRHNERQELTEAVRLEPNSLNARLALARNFLETNDGRAALDVIDSAPPAQRRLPSVLAVRNWALMTLGRSKEVRAGLAEELRSGREPELHLQDAMLKLAARDYTGSRGAAEEVLAMNPEDLRAVRIVMESYFFQRQLPKAQARLLELVAAHPASAPLQQTLGEWYGARGRIAEARKAFEAAKASDWRFLRADVALAELDRRENHVDDARRRLVAILAADPADISALLLSAQVETENGNTEGAIAAYRAILKAHSSHLVALNNLACALASEHADEALALAQRAAAIAPSDPAVADTLGWIYYRKGIYSSAKVYLQRAASSAPTPRRQFHLAMCYLKSGEKSLGTRMLQAALQRDPELMQTERGW
jgi:tetratricopeptide (TPR) repeat protein